MRAGGRVLTETTTDGGPFVLGWRDSPEAEEHSLSYRSAVAAVAWRAQNGEPKSLMIATPTKIEKLRNLPLCHNFDILDSIQIISNPSFCGLFSLFQL